ncbi:methyltransferase family protein [Rivibacter subsaxonicus]|uniref:Methyltransferase family protein n=1 Tax=Rivibacter subsaxonicus TaxID=457575 RepID=A0A4Q7VNR2_9BURK|nr:methyltransferase family protein [Rivibacter subsaxonicus]
MPLWLQTPPGRYLLAWEQERIDAMVGDMFGFHAIQLGLPAIDGLRSNRMPHRWLVRAAGATGEAPPAADADADADADPTVPDASEEPSPLPPRVSAVQCDFAALPFASQSLDLVVLPHTLELSLDPHATLREVERVLVPDGRVVIVGFNPNSLWGLRQWLGRWTLRLALARGERALFLPSAGEFIAHRRLRDWLRLLSFEVESGGFGCYRPALRSQKWLDRWRWIEPAGDRWWPVFGAVYAVVAVKRVRGMRLISPAWKRAPAPRSAPAVATHRHHAQQGNDLNRITEETR